MNPYDVDAVKRIRLSGDSQLIAMTAYQAQKCAVIVEAFMDGQTLYRPYVDLVTAFFKATALEAALGKGYSRPSASVLWQELDELAWPRHGGAQPQQLD